MSDSLLLEVNGQRLGGFPNAFVSRSMETFVSTFSFTATSSNVSNFPIKQGQSCKIYIGGQQILTGYIDKINVPYNAASHILNISGRSNLSDLLDSSVIGQKEFIGPITLVKLIEQVLSDNGVTNVKVVNNAGNIQTFQEQDILSAGVGQSVFEFLQIYARKRQVLLTTDGLGNIVLARTTSEVLPTVLSNGFGNSNIISGNLDLDMSNRFYEYIVRSSQDSTGLAGSGAITNESLVDNVGRAFDDEVRKTRKIEIVSNSPDPDQDLQQIAIWEKNVRRAKSRTHRITVPSFFVDTGKTILWQPNKLVKVEDRFADKNATLLIKSVDYTIDVNGGTQTALTLIERDAFTVQQSINQAEARANNDSNNLGL